MADSAPVGTPLNRDNRGYRSQLPVIGGGTRRDAFHDVGPPHEPSPMTRQPIGNDGNSRATNFGIAAGKAKHTGMGLTGHLGR